MNDRKQPRKRSSFGIAVALLLLVGVPVLYVLSVGPAIWLIMNGYIPEGFAIIYLPLSWLSDNVEPIEMFFDWYVGVWGE